MRRRPPRSQLTYTPFPYTTLFRSATIPLPDRTVLVIMRRADKALTAKVQGDEHSDIGGFWWVSDERVVVSLAEKFGALDQPLPTGEDRKSTRLNSSH